MKRIIFLSLIVFTPAVFYAQDNTAKAKELVSKMTLDEKASLVKVDLILIPTLPLPVYYIYSGIQLVLAR